MTFPANIKFFYGIYIPLSSLDIIPTDYTNAWIFNFSAEDHDEPESDLLEEMGYETHNSILNLGSVFYFMVLYTAMIVVVAAQFVYFKIKALL